MSQRRRAFLRARRWRSIGRSLPSLITERIESNPNIELVREEVKNIPEDEITIIATGPLSSDALTAEIMKLTGSDQLYFLRRDRSDRRGRFD